MATTTSAASTGCSRTRPSRPPRCCTPTSTATRSTRSTCSCPTSRRRSAPTGAASAAACSASSTRACCSSNGAATTRRRLAIASGWSGDHWQLVEKDGRSAIVAQVDLGIACRGQRFLQRLRPRPACTRSTRRPPKSRRATRQALTTPVAATDLRVQGSDVLAVIAFDRDTANAIVDAVTSSAL